MDTFEYYSPTLRFLPISMRLGIYSSFFELIRGNAWIGIKILSPSQ